MYNKIQIELLMLPFTLYNGNKSIRHMYCANKLKKEEDVDEKKSQY